MVRAAEKMVTIKTPTYNRLKKFKGLKTWDELFKLWVDHFEGATNSEDEIRYITNGDWDNLIQRIKQLETNQE